MPNYCNWHIVFSKLSEKDALKLRDCIKKWKFCETVFPQPKEVKDDSKLEAKYWAADKEYLDRTWHFMSADEREKLREKYPYKQLWYDWNNYNWGTKWGMCDAEMTNLWGKINEYSFSCNFWTAWSPLSIAVLGKCSTKFNCDIHYEYDEPWCCFSWIQEYSEWELIRDDYWDDAYYWEVRVCLGCGNSYWETDDEAWYDGHHYICYECGHILVNQYTGLGDKIKKIVNSVDCTLAEDTYRTKVINKILKQFWIDQFEVAEFIYDCYEDWLLNTNNSQNEN